MPESARAALKIRTLGDEDAMLEFPSGSGRWAEYTAEEREIMRTLPRTEMEVLHELKVEFGGTLYPHATGKGDYIEAPQ